MYTLGSNAYGQCDVCVLFISVYTLGNNAYGQCGRHIVEGEIYGRNPRVHRITDTPSNISKVNKYYKY